MNNLNDKEIYVVFDANSGKVVSIHVVGLSTRIPTEAIRVTGEQYARLIEDSNWVYDWDTEKLVYKPVDKSLNLEELREACRNKINAAVSAEIANGFVLKLHGQQVRFSCSDTDQRNITAQFLSLTSGDPYDATPYSIRGYVDADFDKSTITISAADLRAIYTAMVAHIEDCRERGWARKDYVNAANRTIQELEVYINKI